MKLNSIFYFILISYINSSTLIYLYDDITISPANWHGGALASLIDPNNNLNYIYCAQRIYIVNYINNDQSTFGGFESSDSLLRSFEIGGNGTMIIIYYYLEVVEIIKDVNPDQGYHSNKYNINNVFDVFSIGIIEDEWRFVIIDDTTKKIHFQNYLNAKSNNDIYIASFNPNYASFDDIRCKYYITKVFCICIDSTNEKFKFYIIPIDKITNSNQLTISDIDYYSESEIEGKFINIFTFPNSEPLISYSLSSQKFLSNFKGN